MISVERELNFSYGLDFLSSSIFFTVLKIFLSLRASPDYVSRGF